MPSVPSAGRAPARRLVCLSIAAALAGAAVPAFAATGTWDEAYAGLAPDGADRATRLDGVEVTGDRVDGPSSVKYTEPLLDTPQTITVVDRQTMDQQGLLSLNDILSTLPGITFGAGEGGGGYGDSINLRGFNANADITVDGVRDAAQYSRTDNFNLESLELVNGANSVHSGAGAVGGNINLVSKAAQLAEFHQLQLGAGSDDYGRATVDSNWVLGDGEALRLNAMVHRNDVPGRDHERFERWGVAPSFGFNLDGDTRLTLSAFVQRDDNVPQYGVPYFPLVGGLPAGARMDAYYGYRNVDTQEVDADIATAVLEHDFSDAATLRSLLRWSDISQHLIVNPPQGTFCTVDGINPATGGACTGGLLPGQYQPSGPRGTLRDTDTTQLASQTDLVVDFSTGGVEHALVAGVSFNREDYALDNGNVQRNADGSTPVYPVMDLADPDNVYTGPLNYIRAGHTDGRLDTAALYVFDTLKFSEAWHLNLGARWENVDGDLRVRSFAADGTVTADTRFQTEEDLFSWRAGLVFKPAEQGTIYLAWSNALVPSRAAANGSCTALTCDTDPEESELLELGTKWELLDGHLALTASAFRNERENYRVRAWDPVSGLEIEQQNDGRARVDGVSLGLAGNLGERWSVFANATWLDSEVLQGVSDECLANPGTGACGNTPADPDPTRGDRIENTPERAASLWTTYAVSDAWTIGYGITYQGSFNGGRGAYPDVPSYTTHRAMVAWQAGDRLTLQLNIDNLTDAEYFTRVRNNGWATPGEARSVTLTANWLF